MGRIGRRTNRDGNAAAGRFVESGSAAAVKAAHADIAAFTAALASRVSVRADHVADANTRYINNEADSANQLAAVAYRVIGV